MEKERNTLENELSISLIEDGSNSTAINRCVDKILLSEDEGCKLEKYRSKRTLPKKNAS